MTYSLACIYLVKIACTFEGADENGFVEYYVHPPQLRAALGVPKTSSHHTNSHCWTVNLDIHSETCLTCTSHAPLAIFQPREVWWWLGARHAELVPHWRYPSTCVCVPGNDHCCM